MLVSVDAAQIEWRVALELSRDPVGIKEIVSKEDTHSNNQKAFNLPERKIAKIYLFRTIFRGTAYAFSKDPLFSEVSSSVKYWDKVNTLFYEKYNGLDKWHYELCALSMSGKPIVSPFGREWLVLPKTDFRGDIVPAWTVFTNYPVQGTSADVMAIARLSIQRRLNKLGIAYLFVGTIHDSIIFDIPNPKDAQTIINVCHEVFDDLIKNIKMLFDYEWITPLACEGKVGNDLHNMVVLERNS